MAYVCRYLAAFVDSYPYERRLSYDINSGLKEHIASENIKLDCTAPGIVEHHVGSDVPNLPKARIARER